MNSGPAGYDLPAASGLKDSAPGAAYQKGDVIGLRYEVYGVLGVGPFCVVYLVYSRETQTVHALKSHPDDNSPADSEFGRRFREEANTWANLGRHIYLVESNLVEDVVGRLFIAMDYIAPGEQGLNSLEGYLRREPADLAQSLRWAISPATGWSTPAPEASAAIGTSKPANIMIGQDKTVRITDFGLTGALDVPKVAPVRPNRKPGEPRRHRSDRTGRGRGRFRHAGVHASGAIHRRLPPVTKEATSTPSEWSCSRWRAAAGFLSLEPVPTAVAESESARFRQKMYKLHAETPVPKLDSPLFPVIQRCMEKEPDKRYQSFKELRADLEPLLKHNAGGTVTPPGAGAPEAWELTNKAASLQFLGRDEEALRYLSHALEVDPQYTLAWCNKGIILHHLGRYDEALLCHDRAVETDPQLAAAWNNRGATLASMDQHEEAIRCYEQALALDPKHALAWYNKGHTFHVLRRTTKRRSAASTRRWSSTRSTISPGTTRAEPQRTPPPRGGDPLLRQGAGTGPEARPRLVHQGRQPQRPRAARRGDRVLRQSLGARARSSRRPWRRKGSSLYAERRYEDAIRCFDRPGTRTAATSAPGPTRASPRPTRPARRGPQLPRAGGGDSTRGSRRPGTTRATAFTAWAATRRRSAATTRP